jgi:hypothetical protein
VIRRDASIEVSVGGALIGCYAKRDVGGRNAILVGLATDRRVHQTSRGLGSRGRGFADLRDEIV